MPDDVGHRHDVLLQALAVFQRGLDRLQRGLQGNALLLRFRQRLARSSHCWITGLVSLLSGPASTTPARWRASRSARFLAVKIGRGRGHSLRENARSARL